MNFLACDGAITEYSPTLKIPVCSTGWFVLTPAQARTALEIPTVATQNLSPADYYELFQGLTLILVVAFGFRVLKKMFLPQS